MTQNRENYKFMPLAVNNKIQRLLVEQEKDFVWANLKMAVTRRWGRTMGKANSVTGFIMQIFFNRGKELILYSPGYSCRIFCVDLDIPVLETHHSIKNSKQGDGVIKRFRDNM